VIFRFTRKAEVQKCYRYTWKVYEYRIWQRSGVIKLC